MNQRERYISCMTFREVDRIPNMELGVWAETIERWHTEGLPWWVGDLFTLGDHFGMDKSFNCDWMHINSGVYPIPQSKRLEDGGEWEIVEDSIGNRKKQKKRDATIPQYIRFAVEDMSDYEKILPYLDPADEGRYSPDFDDDMKGRDFRGEVRGANFTGLFGFARELMGLEGFSIAIYEQPGLVARILDGRVGMAEKLYGRVFSSQSLDFVQMWEDMAFKTGPLVSPGFMEGYMVERYQRITGFFRAGGVKLILMDCDGNLDLVIPVLKKSGIDGIYPCEVAAGSDPVRLRRLHPGISLCGGVDKRALGAEGREGAKSELRRLQPLIKEGAFIPYIDHFVPPTISYDTFCYYMELKRELLANPGMKI